MKYAGMICLIVSTTAAGFLLSMNSKNKVCICRELISFCDTLSMDISFRSTPITELVSGTLLSERYEHLNFIGKKNLTSKNKLSSPLSSEENGELSEFLYSLGKSDLKSQLDLISGFKEYIHSSYIKYSEQHRKDSKIYITFGFFGGMVLSLIML